MLLATLSIAFALIAGGLGQTYYPGDIVIDDAHYHLVKVYVDNPETWPALVCYNGFSNATGEVACLAMGHVGFSRIDRNPYNPGLPFFDSINCPTTNDYKLNGQRNILRCQFGNIKPSNETCPDQAFATLYCKSQFVRDTENLYQGEVFLGFAENKDSLNSPDGILQLNEKGSIQPVCCSDKFYSNRKALADSACRQIGYTHASQVTCKPIDAGDRTGLYTDNYKCSESMPCLSKCYDPSDMVVAGECGHVYVKCAYNTSVAQLLTSGSQSICQNSASSGGIDDISTSSCTKDLVIGLFVGGAVVAAVFIGLITGRVIIVYKCKPPCKWRRKEYEQLIDHASNIATNS